MGDLVNAFFNGEIFKESLWLLIKTLPIVFEVLVLGLICSYDLGPRPVALIRLSRFRALRYLAGAYIDFFRGLPLLLLFIFIYYGLAIAGLKLNALTVRRARASTLCYGAYSAEIFRAGIQAIPKGQTGGGPLPGHDAAARPCATSSCLRRSSWWSRRSPTSSSP